MRDRLYFKLGRILSEGKGRQLGWLTIILAGVLLLIFLIVKLLLGDSGINSSNILALFFGVDSLNDSSGWDTALMLLIAITGTLLFSTFLISVISNIVDNIADSYRIGKISMNISGHILFLGAGKRLVPMLRKIAETEPSGEIVILTNRDIDLLRETIYAAFEDRNYLDFRKRLIFEFSERNEEASLKAACASRASQIYVIGEDDEVDHDSKSIAAVNILERLCKESSGDIGCSVLLENPDSVKAFVMKGKNIYLDKDSKLQLNFILEYDYIAEKVLSAQSHTPTDYRIGPEQQILPGIGKDTDQFVHIVISGSGEMAKAFARTSFAMLHFPNFDEKTLNRRTVISIVSNDARHTMEEYLASYENIFALSHYSLVTKEGRHSFTPDADYEDFLDIEWEFIEGEIGDQFIRQQVKLWVKDEAQSLSIALCDDDSDTNSRNALSLPRSVYDEKTPVFVYQADDDSLLQVASQSKLYQNSLITFGMTADQTDEDPLFSHRFDMAKRVNYAYSGETVGDENAAWRWTSEYDKLSSTYCALSIPVKVRSFGLDLRRPVKPVMEQLSPEECNLLDRVEHRRWAAGVLLLGYYPMKKTERDDFLQRLSQLDKASAKALTSALKADFVHWDLVSFDSLTGTEQGKDTTIMEAIPYIMTGK